MAVQDHNVILQVLGSLIKNPQFLSEADKYNLAPNDFYYKIDKYIFIAIENLYRNGALKIQPIDIENALSTNETAKLLLKQQMVLNIFKTQNFMLSQKIFLIIIKS